MGNNRVIVSTLPTLQTLPNPSNPKLRFAIGPSIFSHLDLRTGHRGEYRMPEVIIHDDESFERALKRFKKKCEKAGILSDLRKHRHYEKPSERRKRKLNTAMRKNRRTRHV